MKKFLLSFLIIMLVCVSVVNANIINSIDIDIYVTPSGDAKVTEVWDCVTNEGTESFHPFFNVGTSKITDLKVKDEDEKEYIFQDDWDVSGTFEDKKYKCGINESGDNVEICWGISEYGNKKYTANYNLSDFVVNLTDSQMSYWTVIPNEFTDKINDVKVTIYADEKFEDTLEVWGYGDYGGFAYVDDGKIEMQSNDGITSDEYVEFLIKFPIATFNTEVNVSGDFNSFLQMAEDSSEDYVEEEVIKEEVEEASWFEVLLGFIVMILLWGGIIYFIAYICTLNTETIEISKEDREKIKNASYYRDIPCNGDLLNAFYIAYSTKLLMKRTDLMGALILKWLKEKKVTLKKKETKGIFKKEETVVIFDQDVIFEITNAAERNLYKILFNASKDGVLEKYELEEWCNTNYKLILSWFDEILENKKLEFLANDMTLRVRLGTFLKRKRIILGKSVIQEAVNMSGLKKYLTEYTLINERGAIEVELFENYLIFAQLLGIADKVIEEFKELYPDIIKDSSYQEFDNVAFISATANKGVSVAEMARSKAKAYKSGGGGFSSRGGGRGSFGGRTGGSPGSGGGFR